MPKIIFDENAQKAPIKSWCERPEDGAMKQAVDASNHPALHGHVALMPDAHEGFGLPIGGVVALDGAVSPNMVGVDIACGMMAARFDFPASELTRDALGDVMARIRAEIPMGFAHQRDTGRYHDQAARLCKKHARDLSRVRDHERLADPASVAGQLGTLGGGNHFIELQEDESGACWAMVHSGSRNIGKQVCDKYNRLALELNMKRGDRLPSKALSFLRADSEEGRDYLALLAFCVDFSFLNRECMTARIVDALGEVLGRAVEPAELINIHHNYASLESHFGREVWVHRKGAVSAARGLLGIIPGSMGSPSFITEGLGNPDSFNSSSHGAGRVMSRGEALRTLSLKEFRERMGGVLFRCEKSLLDESPMAYKNIREVMSMQKDLVKIVHSLRPLAVEKG